MALNPHFRIIKGEIFCFKENQKFNLNSFFMKKLLTLIAAILIAGSIHAGGLVTNTNHSGLYNRMMSRNASTLIDAVYYNPAGLTKLGDGLYFSLNNQAIWQTRSVINNYEYLSGSPKEYEGKVNAPFFPAIYAAANFGKLSISAGFNPIGGGGGAQYDTGLPSFEMPISDLVPSLVKQGIPTTQYAADIYFEGTSVYMGYQLNLAYKLNDIISVGAGVRLVTAKNTYNGYLKNISINPNYPGFGATYAGSMVFAKDFFTAGSTVLAGLATGATGTATLVGSKITGGVAPATLLSDAANNGLTPDQIGQIQQIMGAAGQSDEQIAAATMAYAQVVLTGAAPVFTAKSTAMAGYAASTADRDVDAEQTGMGYSPILSLNISPVENLNIGLKYEFKTKLNLNTSVLDGKGGGVFTDGSETVADMPAMLAAGVEYRPIKTFMVTGSLNYYFDKNNDYDGSASNDITMIDKNFTEYAVAFELGLTDWFRLSAGYSGTMTGVNSAYQNDQRYSLNTGTIGGGIGLRFSPMIDLNIGAMFTNYKEGDKSFTHMLGTESKQVTETYNKSNMLIGVGLDVYFGKK